MLFIYLRFLNPKKKFLLVVVDGKTSRFSIFSHIPKASAYFKYA